MCVFSSIISRQQCLQRRDGTPTYLRPREGTAETIRGIAEEAEGCRNGLNVRTVRHVEEAVEMAEAEMSIRLAFHSDILRVRQ